MTWASAWEGSMSLRSEGFEGLLCFANMVVPFVVFTLPTRQGHQSVKVGRSVLVGSNRSRVISPRRTRWLPSLRWAT